MRSVLLPFPLSEEPTTEGSAKLNVMEAGLTARNAVEGRGRDAEAFSDCAGMRCLESPRRNEQHREPRKARLGAGHVSLVAFFAPKKATRPPVREPEVSMKVG